MLVSEFSVFFFYFNLVINFIDRIFSLYIYINKSIFENIYLLFKIFSFFSILDYEVENSGGFTRYEEMYISKKMIYCFCFEC